MDTVKVLCFHSTLFSEALPKASVNFKPQYEASFQTNRWRRWMRSCWGSLFSRVGEEVCQSVRRPLTARCLSDHSYRRSTRQVCPEDTRPAPRPLTKLPPSLGKTSRFSFSVMATSAKRKQEETHLKMLREMTSLPANRKCFDCDQRGPTYVNMTVGSFVCTTCSGIL